jgi:hypothetical protein
MMKHCALCCVAAVAALFAAHLWDLSDRQAALTRFLASPDDGARRIVEAYGLNARACASDEHSDLATLAKAFVTVESLVTSRAEAWTRAVVVYGGARLGALPDISAGPGRIRPSTARKAFADMQESAIAPTDIDLAASLLTDCGAVRVARAILAGIRQAGTPAARVDAAFVRRAAAAYNGQAAPTASYEAVLSAEVYFELVYAAYQHYRFAALAAEATTYSHSRRRPRASAQ